MNIKRITKGLLISLITVLLVNMGFTFVGTELAPTAHAAACGYDDELFETLSAEAQADLQQKESDGNCDAIEPATEEELNSLIEDADISDVSSRIGQLNPPEELPEEVQSNILKDAAEAAMKAHRIFAPLINYFAFQIGNFLGNDYIFAGEMGRMLQRIWVISRNLVNIAFVFMLLWIALKTIFTPDGVGELKKTLAKFVLVVVAVNFSWLASKVVLDAAGVATNVVFAIPTGISDPPNFRECEVNENPNKPLKGLCYPTKIFSPADAGSSKIVYWEDSQCDEVEERYKDAYDSEGNENPNAKETNKELWGRTSMCVEKLNIFKYDQNTSTIYLTYGMARIQNLIDATTGSDDGGSGLAVGVLMSIVLQIIYAIALGALFVALIFRMIALWLLVAFSPFLVLTYLMGEGGGDGSGLKKYFSLDQFINWAFVPAKVGVIFTVAFIMISAGQSMGSVSLVLFDTAKTNSGVTFEYFKQDSLFAGVGSLQSLIWYIMVVVVLWLGTFSILGNLTIIGGFMDRIKEGGKTFAGSLAKLPYVAPILPGGRSIQQEVRTVDPYYNVVSSAREFEQDNVGDKISFERSRPNFKTDILPKIQSSTFSHDDAVFIAERFDTSLEKLKGMNETDVKRKFRDVGATEDQADELYKRLQSKWGVATPKPSSRAEAAPTAKPPKAEDKTQPAAAAISTISLDDLKKIQEDAQASITKTNEQITQLENNLKTASDTEKQGISTRIKQAKQSAEADKKRKEIAEKVMDETRKGKNIDDAIKAIDGADEMVKKHQAQTKSDAASAKRQNPDADASDDSGGGE